MIAVANANILVVPLFWSQSPYSLKPKPVLDRSDDENEVAITTHFRRLIETYGRIICINLAESTGREEIIGSAYKKAVSQINNDNIE
jgi:phosphatidylinositol 4-phosphatase